MEECDELYADVLRDLNRQHQDTGAAVNDDECDELYGDLLNKPQHQETGAAVTAAASQGDLNEENLESMDKSKSQESEEDFEIILNDENLESMDKSKSQESEKDFDIILNDKNNPSPPKEGFHRPYTSSFHRRCRSGSYFALPPDKTVFDVNLDLLEDKRWKHPGVDISDFFNYDLDEDKWKDYCKALEKHQLELMQKEKRIYETVRVEQHIGSPIPVHIGPGDRVPSYEFKPPRWIGRDTIIEVQLSDRSEQEQQSDHNENRQ